MLSLSGAEHTLSQSGGWSLQLIAAIQFNLEGLEVGPVIWLSAPTLKHDFVEKVRTFGWYGHSISTGNLPVDLLIAKG